MRLARAVGLTTVDVEPADLGGIDCLIVEQFDRVIVNGEVRRIHQEDACQALGLAPTRKCELPGRGAFPGGGGPEFSQVAGLLDKHAIDACHELEQLARVAAFTAITGNADAHGKNLGLLDPDRSVLAASEMALALLEALESASVDPTGDVPVHSARDSQRALRF